MDLWRGRGGPEKIGGMVKCYRNLYSQAETLNFKSIFVKKDERKIQGLPEKKVFFKAIFVFLEIPQLERKIIRL